MAFWSGSSIISINTSTPNSGTGDNLYDAFVKVDNNFGNISTQLSSVNQDFYNANVQVLLNAGSANITNLFSPNITTSAITLPGNVTAGNLVSTNGLTVAGTATLNGNTSVGNILPISGGVYNLGSPGRPFANIYVQNTVSTTQISQSTSAGIFQIHANIIPGDQQDVGILGNISNEYTTNAYAFFGHQFTTNNFVYKITPNNAATVGNSVVYDGIYGNTQFGSQFLSNTTISTSTATGALIVAGGAGIGGNLNVGANITVANVIASGTVYSGGYPVITPNSPGVGIFYNSGSIFQQNVAINIPTQSTSTGTGALVVTGGIGSSGNINAFGFVGPLYGQVQTAAQPNITSVGILTGLTVTAAGTISTGTLQANSVGTSYATIGSLNATTITTGSLLGINSLNLSGNLSAGGIVGSYYGTVQTAAQPNITSVGVLSGLSVSGNLASTSTIYGQGIYDNGVRVVSTSTGSGNLSITGNAISLTQTGPGAITVGGATNIPVITTDAFGRIISASNVALSVASSTINLAGTTGTGSVNTGGTITFSGTYGVTVSVGSSYANISTPQDLRTTATPTFANITVANATVQGNTSIAGNLTVQNIAGNLIPVANLTYNLGSTTAWWNNIYGTAVHAQYADLAEMYASDEDYPPGTVLIFGGELEVTISNSFCDSRVAGVVSTNPAYLMNSETAGVAIALRGRVPVRVHGPVAKGDLLVTSSVPGCAQSGGRNVGLGAAVFAKALEDSDDYNEKIIEAVIL